MTLFFRTINSFFPFIKIINQRYYCDHTMSFYMFLYMYAKKNILLCGIKSSVLRFFFCNILFVVVRLSQRHHPFKPAINIYIWCMALQRMFNTLLRVSMWLHFVVLSLPNQSKRGLHEQVFCSEIIY